jgi:hypothetical protein
MIFEMVSLSQFNTPNNYLHDFKAVNGNSIPNEAKQKEVLTFLNLNVYSPTIYNEGIIMPVAKEAFRFYNFELIDSKIINDSFKVHKISFMPKRWSQKLLCGYLYIIDQNWRIDKIDVNGRFSFAEFNLVMSFGRNHSDFILPQKADLFLRYNVLGNAITSTYHTSFNYKTIVLNTGKNKTTHKKKTNYDLTAYYQVSSNTVPIIQDSNYWNKKRDIPLTVEEMKAYQKKPIASIQKSDTGEIQKYLELTDEQRLKRLVKFTSHVWQVHPFGEGNTKTTAVFIQKYLNSKGFNINNELFKDHSLYFRNALVRSNYSNIPKGIDEDNTFLIRFFENLLFNKKNELDNSKLYL